MPPRHGTNMSVAACSPRAPSSQFAASRVPYLQHATGSRRARQCRHVPERGHVEQQQLRAGGGGGALADRPRQDRRLERRRGSVYARGVGGLQGPRLGRDPARFGRGFRVWRACRSTVSVNSTRARGVGSRASMFSIRSQTEFRIFHRARGVGSRACADVVDGRPFQGRDPTLASGAGGVAMRRSGVGVEAAASPIWMQAVCVSGVRTMKIRTREDEQLRRSAHPESRWMQA